MKNTINQIKSIIEVAEKMKKSYFFQSPNSANSRRSYEKYYSRDIVAWKDGNDCYTAAYSVSCSCKNVYTHGIYTKNGKKTTLTAIKNSLKRLESAN